MFGDLRHFGDLLRRNAEVNGARGGIVYGDVRLTWREVNARANRFASCLQRRGLSQGDRVAILSRNCHQYVEALFGLAKIGAVSVPINYRLTAPEVEFIVKDSGAAALLSGPDDRATAERLPSIHHLVELGAEYERLLEEGEESEPAPERSIDPEDLLLLLYTSGTTGFPKGVMYTHRRTLIGMFVHVHAIGSHPSHRVMLPSPLYSAAGIAGIFCAVFVGCHIVLINFEPKLALETIDRERITFTNFVPTTIQMLVSSEDVNRFDLASLRVLLYGGSPMPEPVLRRAAQVFRCDFRQTFAASETGCSGTVLEPEEHRLALTDPAWTAKLASCGRPQVGVGVRVVNDQGKSVSPGETGEIAVLSDGNMVGYWNNPEATAEVLRDGWVHTGDLAMVDSEGYIYIVDRKNDMIVTGALNVYPNEVERVLYEHPAVHECAVIGVPHPVWGEAVKAVVVLKPGYRLAENELISFCEGRLASFKKPKSVDFAARLPRNPTGKVLRRMLREPYWEKSVRKI
jgi:acyl-CoA synthetase (AMP-forming)/AMP-acid ligase II